MDTQEVDKTNLESDKMPEKVEVDQELLDFVQPTKETEEIPQEKPAEVTEPPTTTTSETTEEKFTFGEHEYTQSEIAELLEKGRVAKEWESKVPGNNITKLQADYTKKSQKLAEYEKQFAPPVEQNSDEVDLPPDQIDLFKKVAKQLGFVQREDLVKGSVDAQKDAFLAEHPEYLPANDPTNEKWSALVGAFNEFNWQQNPNKVADFLERSHAQVAPRWQEPARGGEMKRQILQRKSIGGLAQLGGGAAANAPQTKNTKLTEKNIQAYRNGGWSEDDIKELLN